MTKKERNSYTKNILFNVTGFASTCDSILLFIFVPNQAYFNGLQMFLLGWKVIYQRQFTVTEEVPLIDSFSTSIKDPWTRKK